jgi:hypothetical protein
MALVLALVWSEGVWSEGFLGLFRLCASGSHAAQSAWLFVYSLTLSLNAAR